MSQRFHLCCCLWLTVLQVTPALARKLLASNANQLALTLQRQQQRWQQQQAVGQPAAAVLLQYCLSDGADSSSRSNAGAAGVGLAQLVSNGGSSSPSELSVELLGALRQLNGLPLLPAADGSLQTIKLQTSQQMHSSRAQPAPPGSDDAASVLYVPADSIEQQLLAQLPGQLLHPSVSGDLKQQLLQIAAAGVSNIRLITCKTLDEHILPQLFNSSWFGQLEVTWVAASSAADAEQLDEAQQQQQQQQQLDEAQQQQLDEAQQQQQQQQRGPSREFIKLLWQWLGQRGDAAELAHWPVLPVAGGKLRLLQQPAQVRPLPCCGVVLCCHDMLSCYVAMLCCRAVLPCCVAVLCCHAMLPCCVVTICCHAVSPCHVVVLCCHAMLPSYAALLCWPAMLSRYTATVTLMPCCGGLSDVSCA
jgi:hypothetical protein